MKDVYYNNAQKLMTIHVTAGCTLFYNNYYYLHVHRGKVPSKVITVACRFPTCSFVVTCYAFRDG